MRAFEAIFLLSLCKINILRGNPNSITQWPAVDNLIEEFRSLNSIPGVALAIVSDNGTLLSATGYGVSDREDNTPMRNRTRFLIASISKVPKLNSNRGTIVRISITEFHGPYNGQSVKPGVPQTWGSRTGHPDKCFSSKLQLDTG